MRVRLHRVILDELGARGEPDRSRCAIDPVGVRAAKGGHWAAGPLTGPNPTDHGKPGPKIHLITDRNGVPLSLGISGADMYESLGLGPARARDPARPLPLRPTPAASGQAPRI